MALILMLNDEKDACRLFQRMLSGSGHSLQTFTSAREALLWLQDNTPELALFDLKRPEKNGMNVLEFIKRHRPETKVLVLTGNPSMDMACKSLDSSEEDCLIKPVEIDELEVRINKALGLIL